MKKQHGPEGPHRRLRKAGPVYHSELGDASILDVLLSTALVLAVFGIVWALGAAKAAGWL